MIADIIIIAIIIVFIIVGIRNGLARSLLNLASVIVALVVSRFFAGYAAEFVYNGFIKPATLDNLESLITQNGSDYAIENSISALPGWVRGLLDFSASMFGKSSSDLQNGLSSSTVQGDSFIEFIEQPIESLVMTILTVILTMLIFIIIEFLLKRFVVRAVAKVFDIPVIKQINSFLGGIVGCAEGFVFVIVAVNIFYSAALCMNPTFFENELIMGDLFKIFCFYDIN